jgi:hypothetical protein
MVTINDILHFAFNHKEFTRKELIAFLKESDRISTSNSLSEQLNRLLKSRQLIRLERGVYQLPNNAKKDFSVICSEEIKKINLQIKEQFPFINYCIWSGSSLIQYMQHVPNINLTLVDVEREVADSVFNFLNAENNKRIFLMPTLIEFERYINSNEAIIIRPLISESPLKLTEGIKTPTIEKILVDILGDIEFSFLQGLEISYVYKMIFERHFINRKRLIRYATRRGRIEKVNQLLNTNNL